MKFCWVTMNVKDMEASLRFYHDVLGLEIHRRMKPMPGTEIVFLGTETETEVELIQNDKNTAPAYGKDISLGFEVENVNATMTEFQEKQIPIHSGPFQPGPTVKFFFVDDKITAIFETVEQLRQTCHVHS